VLVTEDIAARLDEHARQAHGALAPETERALRKASAAFSWAATQGLPALSATAETVAAYVDALTGSGRKHSPGGLGDRHPAPSRDTG
jgi:hypothetical protein